jgi:hypothetical protein
MANRNPDYYLWTLFSFSIGTSVLATVYDRKFFLYVEAGTILYCLGRYLFTRKSVGP